MTAVDVLDPPQQTEAERVEAWRLSELIHAGYPVPIAEKIASQPEIDLHQAIEITLAGCPPDLALQILL